jgi:hypothetical protein
VRCRSCCAGDLALYSAKGSRARPHDLRLRLSAEDAEEQIRLEADCGPPSPSISFASSTSPHYDLCSGKADRLRGPAALASPWRSWRRAGRRRSSRPSCCSSRPWTGQHRRPLLWEMPAAKRALVT